MTKARDDERASTGVAGFDWVLKGGLPRDEMHLLQGSGGTGKTTLALQFLLAGAAAGEDTLYVTLSQTKHGLEKIARSHGWSLDGVIIHELSPGSVVEHLAAHQTVLHTAEVELGELTQELRKVVERTKPRRVVFDSIGVIGLLAGNATRYHREIVLLRQFLTGHGCTALFLGDWPGENAADAPANTEFHSLTASVIHLEQIAVQYGEVRRRMRVMKMRGVPISGGYHDFRIRKGGIEIYPRLEHATDEYSEFRHIETGMKPLDELLGGGLEQGTACLFVGPSGAGKSTLATCYARAVARDGDHAAIFLLDERRETFMVRSHGLGIGLDPFVKDGRVVLHELPTADITPGEFAQRVRAAVERKDARVVVIDSLTGYFNAMENAPMLVVQMHELLTYLSRRGVLTILTVSQEGFMSTGPSGPQLDVSYLSDTIIVLRTFEVNGVVRRCLIASKKRQGEHETTIREMFFGHGRIEVGAEPLQGLRGILRGDPEPIESPKHERR
jgi:circadian clock protein KaiC